MIRLTYYTGIFVLIVVVSSCRNGQHPVAENEILTTARPTTWMLKTLHEKPVAIDSLFVTFDRNRKTLSGFGGCNRITGNYNFESGNTEISPAATTRMLCETESSIEKEFLNCLAKTDSVIINSDTLLLFSDSNLTAILTTK